MGAGMNKILPGLYLGNIRDSGDHEQLEKHNITHIVRVFEDPKQKLDSKFQYLCIDAQDHPGQDLEQHFTTCIEFIHSCRLAGGNVLVHCLAGVSRSATIVTAYVMTVTELPSHDVIKAVRQARNVVNPNPGFRKQLQSYEEKSLRDVKGQLVEKYGEISSEDLAFIKNLLEEFNSIEVDDENTATANAPTKTSKLIKQYYKEKKEKEKAEAASAAEQCTEVKTDE